MKNLFGILIVLAVAVGGGWYLLSRAPASEPSGAVTNQMPVIGSTTPEMNVVEAGALDVSVVYTDQGFTPKNINVLDGTTVFFINQSSKDMWVASAMHPAHAAYDGTSLNQHCTADYRATDNPAPFDQCSSGANYSLTFTRVGTWKYHNHNAAGDTGTITVTTTGSSVIER